MTYNIMTVPKISLGLFFILMFIGSFHFSHHSIVYLLMKHWLIYLILVVSIYYLFSTSFKPSKLTEEHPATSYVALFLSVVIFLADLLLISVIINSDRDTYETIYFIGVILLFFWIPLGLFVLNFLDRLLKKQSTPSDSSL